MLRFPKGQASISLAKNRKLRPNMYYLLALAAAILAGLIVVGALKAAIPTTTVVVAKETLEPGDRIVGAAVDVYKVPKAAVAQDAITIDTIGSNNRLAATVIKGDIIRRAHLSSFRQPGGVASIRALMLGRNYRAMALPPEATKGLSLMVGDKVDLTGVVDVPGTGGNATGTLSRLLVQAATVVLVPDADPKSYNAGDPQIVVAVPSQQVSQLALAVVKGEVVATTNLGESPSFANPVTLNAVFGFKE